MKGQEYAPFLSKIVNVKKHTEIEYTFSMEYFGKVKPGQFFQVSIPKYGEAPISVSGIGPDYVCLLYTSYPRPVRPAAPPVHPWCL